MSKQKKRLVCLKRKPSPTATPGNQPVCISKNAWQGFRVGLAAHILPLLNR